MKSRITFLSLVISCTFTIYAQTLVNKKAGDGFANSNNAKAQLQLTTSIVEQVSCTPNNIVFTLKLTFRNASQRPLILNKKYLMEGIWVSRDLRAAAAKQYETYFTYELFSSDEGLEPPAISDFLILGSGEVYDLEDKVSIFTNDVTPYAGGYLHPGNHFLQVLVDTWPYIADSGPYRRKWRDKGSLWSQELLSLPMPFTIEKDRPVSKCSTTLSTK